MKIRKIKKWPGPKKIGEQFARGYWISMLAEMYGVEEIKIEMALMNFCSKATSRAGK